MTVNARKVPAVVVIGNERGAFLPGSTITFDSWLRNVMGKVAGGACLFLTSTDEKLRGGGRGLSAFIRDDIVWNQISTLVSGLT